MSGTESSDEEIEQGNVFQQVRTNRLKKQRSSARSSPDRAAAHYPESPTRSPTRSPEHKIRKVDSGEHQDPHLEALTLGESALLVPPPIGWIPPNENENDDVREGKEDVNARDNENDENGGNEIEVGYDASLSLPSSSALDTDPWEDQHLQAILAERPISKPEATMTLERLVQLKLPGRFADTYVGNSHPSDLDTTVLNPGMSRVEKVDAEALVQSVARLRHKMKQESQQLELLKSWEFDRQFDLDIDANTILAESTLRAQMSAKKHEFNQLRATRMRLLQLLNDVHHESSEMEAQSRAQSELWGQLQEARQLATDYKAKAREADTLAAQLQKEETHNDELAAQLQALERQSGWALAELTESINPQLSKGLSNAETALVKARITDLVVHNHGVQIGFLGAHAVLRMRFMLIYIHLDTHEQRIVWSYPPTYHQIGDHYKSIISRRKMGFQAAIKTWRIALHTLHYTMNLAQICTLLDFTSDFKSEVTKIAVLGENGPETVELHGTSVVVGESLPAFEKPEADMKHGSLNTLQGSA